MNSTDIKNLEYYCLKKMTTDFVKAIRHVYKKESRKICVYNL